MLRLFFRDGSPYAGPTPHTFKPIKGEARVRVYDRIERRYRNTTVYTEARLDDLRDRKRYRQRTMVAPARRALIEVTREFKAFARERDRLITDIYALSALSPTLQVYTSKIDQGQILCAAEIRNAIVLVSSLKRNCEG